MLNPIQRFFEKKSNNSPLATNQNNSAAIFVGSDGSLLKTIYYSLEEAIKKNLTINTIINRQSSIVNEARLVVKERSDSQDTPTKQKEFLDFIKWINNPNARPFPTSRNDIFKYMLSNYYRKGVYGVIYVFSKDKEFKNIQIPHFIRLNAFFSETRYSVGIKNRNYDFRYDISNGNYTVETDSEIMILQVGGHFDNDEQNYTSYFSDVMPYILLQNYLIEAAESFQKNSCYPSQIVTITYERSKDEVGELDSRQRADFEKAVKEIGDEIRRSRNLRTSGGSIIAQHPHIKIDIKPLNTPMNAKEHIDYISFVNQNIYPLIDGGSVNSYQGISQYSNNLTTGIENMYDGAFRQFNSIVIDSMDKFMRSVVSWINPSIATNNYYLTFDESSVKIYQIRTINQIISLTQNNMLKINQGQQILSTLAERYAFIKPDPKDDIYNSQLSGNATKPRIEMKSVKPTEDMIYNAKRGLEWKSKYQKGGEIGFDFENVAYDNLERMTIFFAKNEKKSLGFWAGDEGFPSEQRINWDLNGGDAGKNWALEQLKELS